MKIKKLMQLFIICLFLVSCGKKTEYYCDKGEMVDGVCEVTELVDAKIVCPTGYTFNLEKGKCVYTMKIAAKTVNKCSKGYVIGNEKWCISEKKYDIILTHSCESKKIKEGDTLSSTYIDKANQCIEKICVEKSQDGKECKKYQEKSIAYTSKRSCPESSMRIWENYCRKVSWMYIDTSCEVGVLEGDKCLIENLSDANISCDEGYTLRDDYKCQKITYKEPIEK